MKAVIKSTLVILLLGLLVSVLSISVGESYSGLGSGTANDPYQITNIEELQAMQEDLSAYYILMNDIDASVTVNWNENKGFVPIGSTSNPFLGQFDGQGHIIHNLFINRGGFCGLFGVIAGSSRVKNVGLENVQITGTDFVGALVGRAEGSSIVSNSYSTGSVTGNWRVGGLVGKTFHAEVYIFNSYSKANVTGVTYVGGLLGRAYGSPAYVRKSYSTGLVSATGSYVGGLIGYHAGVVENSFYDTETSGKTSSSGGIGKTTSEMQSIGTYSDAGWDIVLFQDYVNELWYIKDGKDYPKLGWQYEPVPGIPPIPSSFYGEIHFMPGDGGPNSGDVLHAYVDGGVSPVASATITQPGDHLVYAINVPGNAADPQPSTVTFKIGTRIVATADWVSGTNVLLDIHPPKANPGGPYVAEAGETITINGSASDWFTEETFMYAWDLDGDGQYDDSTAQNPAKAFTEAGIKSISLKVTDSQGGEGFAGTEVVVISISGLTGQVYDGSPKPVAVSGVSEPYSVSILYGAAPGSSTAPVDAGTYPVAIDIKQGGTVLRTLSKELVVGPRPITVEADPQTKVYGEADPPLTYQITSGILVEGDAFTGSLVRSSGENVGFSLISQGSLSAGPNYALAFVGATLKITPRPITVTADAKTKVYGVADPPLTYQITFGSLVFSDEITGSLEREPGANVGSYPITKGSLTAGDNYSLTYVGANLSITPRPITVTADAQEKVYGDIDPALTYQITDGSLVEPDVFSGALERAAGEVVASYAISEGTLSAGTNYDLSVIGANLTITQRPVTVTADNLSKVFGALDPDLTYKITSGSLAFSDTFDGALSRVGGEDVGTYDILQGTLALSSNYSLSYIKGIFTITANSVTVTTTAGQSKIFGTDDPVFAYTYSPDDPEITFSGTLSRDPGEDVGTYAIRIGSLAAENYTINFVSAGFEITPKSATVSLSELNQTYDGDPKPVTVTTDPPEVQVTVTYNGGSTAPSATGTYAVVATITDPNYTGDPAAGTLVITTSHQITLLEGWNLVSFNIQPYPSTAPEDVLASIAGKYNLVYAWDASGAHAGSGHWMKHDTIPQTTDTLTVLNEKTGFWILMDEPATLQVQGFMPTTTEISLRNAAGGWNLVGFPSSTSAALPGALEGHGVATDGYTLVYSYQAADTLDPWKLYDKGAPSYANDLNSLEPGWGYWIFVTQNADWSVPH